MTSITSRVWFGIFILVVFLGGVGTGVLVNREIEPPDWGRGSRPPGPMGGGLLAGRLVRRMTAELDLTPDQQARLEAVFAERRGRMARMNREVRTRFEAEQRELRAEIENVLTPEQRQRFQKWLRLGPPRPFGRPPGGRPGAPPGGPPGLPF